MMAAICYNCGYWYDGVQWQQCVIIADIGIMALKWQQFVIIADIGIMTLNGSNVIIADIGIMALKWQQFVTIADIGMMAINGSKLVSIVLVQFINNLWRKIRDAPYQGKATAAARAALPSLASACWVFSCFRNPSKSYMDCRIFNVLT